jgi:hypothetical protein
MDDAGNRGSIRLCKVISGGQTGVDQGVLRAAIRFAGIETGGWAPKFWFTEEGPRIELGLVYGLKEDRDNHYASRTRKNAAESDGTILIADKRVPPHALARRYDDEEELPRRAVDPVHSPGTQLAIRTLAELGKPYLMLRSVDIREPMASDLESVKEWLIENDIATLNVGGNRESGNPGIGELTEKFFVSLFLYLGFDKR